MKLFLVSVVLTSFVEIETGNISLSTFDFPQCFKNNLRYDVHRKTRKPCTCKKSGQRSLQYAMMLEVVR